MVTVFRLFVFVAIALGFSTSSQAQHSCAALGNITPLQDGALYGRDPSGKWIALSESQLIPATRWPYRVRLLYVAKADPNQLRSGVIVTKAGRFLGIEPDRALSLKPVRLRRIETGYTCGKGSFKGEVTAESYDAYHDRGYDWDRITKTSPQDVTSLQNFHTKYTGAGNECASSTDNATWDSFGRADWRSNRSQFSYDDKRVKGGLRSQTLAALRIDRAVASLSSGDDSTGSVGLADQLVEIKRYRVEANSATCIPLTVQVTGQQFFIRINDLEARSLIKWERQWQFLR